uniref:G_PROTEIN_RECEP_F2_4 domain-containing protein n=1 Tax=Panagrellus redivivus TaxID=6233 RepID=A0A7E4UYZ8_PANRE
MICLTSCNVTIDGQGTNINIYYADRNHEFRPLIDGGKLFIASDKFQYIKDDHKVHDIPLCSVDRVTLRHGNSNTALCVIDNYYGLNCADIPRNTTHNSTTPTTVSTTSVATTPVPTTITTTSTTAPTTEESIDTTVPNIPTTEETTTATTTTFIPSTTKVTVASTSTTQTASTSTTFKPTTSSRLPDLPEIDCNHPITPLFELFCNLTMGTVTVTPGNLESVINKTIKAYKPLSDDKNSLFAVAVIFHNCSQLTDMSHNSFEAMSRLLDHAIDTDSNVFTATNTPMYSVSNRLSSGLFSMLVNAPPNATYLTGNNLALHVHALDCTQNDAGGISIGADDTFKLTHRQDELSSIAINAQSACSAGATRVHYTIYRNSKLFLGTSDNDTSNGVISSNTYDNGLVGSTTKSDGFEKPCHHGFYEVNGMVLAATAVANVTEDVKVIHKAADVNQTMVKMRFKRNNIGVALHGKLKVTFWETDNRRWSQNTCNVKKDGKYYVSECTHLTDFTLIVDGTAKDPALCSETLSIINDVIVIGSIIALTSLSAIYLIIFVAPKKSKQTVLAPLINFAPPGADGDPFLLIQALLLMAFFYIFCIFSDSTAYINRKDVCIAIAVMEYWLLMGTSVLAVFQAWRTAKLFTANMAVERVLSLITKPLPMYLSVFLVPSLLTVIFWLVSNGDFFWRHDGFCWIRSDYIIPAVIIPMTFLICNAVACFGLFTKRMFPQFSTRIIRGQSSITINNKATDAKERLARLFISQFTLGVPWVLQYFALFAPTTTAWHYCFAILNGSQGIVFLVAFIFRGISARRQQNSLWRQRHAVRLASLAAHGKDNGNKNNANESD